MADSDIADEVDAINDQFDRIEDAIDTLENERDLGKLKLACAVLHEMLDAQEERIAALPAERLGDELRSLLHESLGIDRGRLERLLTF